MQQVIINNCREVGILEVVAVDGKPFLNLLLDEIIDDGIGLTAARRSQYGDRTERIHHVYPAFPFLSPVPEFGRQVNGILVFHKAGFLHERFILGIENVLQQIVLQQTANP